MPEIQSDLGSRYGAANLLSLATSILAHQRRYRAQLSHLIATVYFPCPHIYNTTCTCMGDTDASFRGSVQIILAETTEPQQIFDADAMITSKPIATDDLLLFANRFPTTTVAHVSRSDGRSVSPSATWIQ